MAHDEEGLAFHGHPRNIQYTTKVAKLSNQTEDGIARLLADESDNFLERQYARLFAVVDVGFTEDAYDVSEVVIETLQNEFYGDLNRTVEESFEACLTTINQTLADLAAEGQNGWVGKLNAVIGALSDNQIYLSAVGNAKAFLVRGHSSTDISEGLAKPQAGASAKTFFNVAAGELEVGDKVLVTTDGLLRQISQVDFRRHLYLHPPARAIRRLADQMLDKGMPGRLAAVVIELTTIDLISAETVSDEPDEIVLGAPRRHFEKLQKFKPLHQDTPLATGLATAKKYYEKRFKPAAGRTFDRAQRAIGRAPRTESKPQAAAGTPETSRRERPGLSRPDPKEVARQTADTARSALNTGWQKAREAAGPAREKAAELWRRTGIADSRVGKEVAKWWGKFVALLEKTPLNRAIHPRKGEELYRNLAVLIFIILAISIYSTAHAAANRRADERVREKIKTAQELQSKAEASFIYKDLAGARQQLDQAKATADALTKQGHLKKEVAELETSLLTSYDHINNVVSVPDAPLTNVTTAQQGANPKFLAITGPTLYSIGDKGALYSTDIPSHATKIANANPGLLGNVKSLATTSNGNVLILTDRPTVFTLDAASGVIAEASLAGGATWEPGTLIDTVQQNAYILEPAKNQVWKHVRTIGNFSKGTAFLRSAADLKNAVDMVTGARVYILNADGSLLVYVDGAAQGVNLKPPPSPQKSIGRTPLLAVNSTTGKTYIADVQNHRIIENSSDGKYTRQFRGDMFEDARDMVIDEKTNTLYLLSGTKIYKVSLGG